jgi:outer membrane protein
MHWILFLIVAGSMAYSAPGDIGSPPVLTLNNCYDLAVERNERLGVAAAEWRAAEARYRQVRDTLLPAISLGGSALFQNDRREDGNDSASREPERFSAALRAEQVLYQGFRVTREMEAREAGGRAARWDERRVRELLYLDVADAFHQVVLNERDLALVDRLVQVLEETQAELERRVKLGRSRKAELLQAQTALAEARVEQETARGQVAVARELLAFLMGRPAEGWQLKDESPFPSAPELAAKLEQAVQRADVQAGLERAEAARKAMQAAQGERQPEVRAAGNVYLVEDPDEDREWDVALTLSLPLFDEGVRRAGVREQMEQATISELNLAALRRQAVSEVRSAYLAFVSTAAQKARLQEGVAVATASYEEQQRDFELGRASQLDALSALAQVQRLARRALAADIRARVSLVQLHVAAGEGAP